MSRVCSKPLFHVIGTFVAHELSASDDICLDFKHVKFLDKYSDCRSSVLLDKPTVAYVVK